MLVIYKWLFLSSTVVLLKWNHSLVSPSTLTLAKEMWRWIVGVEGVGWTLLIFGGCHFVSDLQWVLWARGGCAGWIDLLVIGFYTEMGSVNPSIREHTAFAENRVHHVGSVKTGHEVHWAPYQHLFPLSFKFTGVSGYVHKYQEERGRKHKEIHSSVVLTVSNSRGQKWWCC